MAGKRKGARKSKARKPFRVNLDAANWPRFQDDVELQAFLNAHVTGEVSGKGKGKGKSQGWKSVTLHISLEPKNASPALSLTEVSYIGICPKQPCP